MLLDVEELAAEETEDVIQETQGGTHPSFLFQPVAAEAALQQGPLLVEMVVPEVAQPEVLQQ